MKIFRIKIKTSNTKNQSNELKSLHEQLSHIFLLHNILKVFSLAVMAEMCSIEIF